MRRSRENLSGFWVGRYAYEGSVAEPVQFLATIEESGGTLSGTISEPNQIGHSSKELHAFLSGTREGADVFFAKTYDGASDAAHRVDYFGQVSDDGRRIAGHWLLAGASGSFDMSREILDEDEEAVERVEEVEDANLIPGC